MKTERRDNRDSSAAIPDAEYYEAQPEFDVGSWSPAPPGTPNAPCTQVHVRFGTPPGVCMVVRLKNAKTADALIDALIEHREYVWGRR